MPYAGSSSSISTLVAGDASTDGPVLVAVGAQLDGAVEPRPRARCRTSAAGSPVSRCTARRSRGPTVTVPETGSMSSTNRGLPSGAGRPSRSPLRWPIVNAVGALVARRAPRRRLVDDRAPVVGRAVAELLAQPAGVVAVGDEADVVAVRLVGDPQPAARRPRRAPSALVEPPSGNSECAQLVLVEHAEHVGLVLAVVDRPVHLDQPVGAGAQLGVVTGRDRVEAERRAPGRARRRT